MERSFWNSLLHNTEPKTRQQIESNWEAVQISVMIGTLFRIFSIEGEKIFVAKITLQALPTLLKYRIPALRGSAKPYEGAEPRRNPVRTARLGS